MKKEVAIIGIAGKLPGANSALEFWGNLKDGLCSIDAFPECRKKDVDKYLKYIGKLDDGVGYGEMGYLDEIDKFDYSFFNLSKEEALLISPEQRLFLESVWTSVEDAGYNPGELSSETAVFVGYNNDLRYLGYFDMIDELKNEEEIAEAVSGNVNPVISGRISDFFNLHGVNMMIDTVCSSSLVALHLACEEIREGKIKQAIVGSVNIDIAPKYIYDRLPITSLSSKLKAFDDNSNGTVWGEGVVSVLVKDLEEAIRDGDHIYTVIKGGAVNHDGKSMSLTAPNPISQVELLNKAWEDAQIDPSKISYIEAHGTGTKIGDPIEVGSIKQSFESKTEKKQFCALGALKNNIGHLGAVAGLASVLKMALSFENKKITPIVNFEIPNKGIDFENSPVFVNDRVRDWSEGNRLAGINSFSYSGTNAHMVLGEAPCVKNFSEESKSYIITMSAKSEWSLRQLIVDYKKYFKKNSKINLSDLCFTANVGRGDYGFRVVILFDDYKELKQKIGDLVYGDFNFLDIDGIYYSGESLKLSNTEKKELTLVLLSEISFEDVDKSQLKTLSEYYVRGASIKWNRFYKNIKCNRINLPTYPFERTRAWVEVGDNVIRSGIKGKKMNEQLIDVQILEMDDEEVFVTDFSIEKHWTISEHKVLGTNLLVGVGFLEMALEACRAHIGGGGFCVENLVYLSPLFLDVEDKREVYVRIKKNDGVFGFEISSVSINEGEKNGESWIKHAQGTLRVFSKKNEKKYKIEDLKKEVGDEIIRDEFLRMVGVSSFDMSERWNTIRAIWRGENKFLLQTALRKQYLDEVGDFILYPSLFDTIFMAELFVRDNETYMPFSYKEIKFFGSMRSSLYSLVKAKKGNYPGKDVNTFDIELLDNEGKVFAEIKEYSFKKIESSDLVKIDEKNFFHRNVWQKKDKEFAAGKVSKCILVFGGTGKVALSLLDLLQKENTEVVEVRMGNGFEKLGDNSFLVGDSVSDYKKLFEEIRGRRVEKIVHLSSIDKEDKINSIEKLESSQKLGVLSLFNILKVVQRESLDLILVSSFSSCVVENEKNSHPERSTLFGLGSVVRAENRNINCKMIDVDDATGGKVILKEIVNERKNGKMSYRNNDRYELVIDSFKLPKDVNDEPEIKKGGVYVVTGGTGGLGFEMVKFLADKKVGSIILLSRREFASRDKWGEIVDKNEKGRELDMVKWALDVEKKGLKVHFFAVDVGDYNAMKNVFNTIGERCKKINGILHLAGVPGDGFIINKSKIKFKEVLRPKVQGTWVLDEVSKDFNLDFFVAFSSVASLFGAAGQGDYAAGSLYLDNYVTGRFGKSGKALSINWPIWQETGMAFDKRSNIDALTKSISTRVGMVAFEKVINVGEGSIIACEIDPDSELLYTKEAFDLFSVDVQKKINNRRLKRALDDKKNTNINFIIKGRSDGKYTEIEKEIAKTWANFLNLIEIDINDNFFDIGGDSLTAVRSLGAFNEKYGLDVSIMDLFDHTTVKSLSRLLGKKVDLRVIDNKSDK